MLDALYPHPSEEALERFLMNTSGPEELEATETHILCCDECLDQCETLEVEIALTRVALKNLEEHKKNSVSLFTEA